MPIKSPLIILLLLLCACAPKGPPLVGRFFFGERRFPFDYRGNIAPDEPE